MAKLLSAALRQNGGRGATLSPRLIDFVTGLMAEEGEDLRRIRTTTEQKGLPAISIGPLEGRILDFLVRVCGARKAVEVGTLAGYSACWIARALPKDGMLHSFEYDPRHARVAKDNIARVGLADRIDVRVGNAAKILAGIEDQGPFDFCFIDADKAAYPAYLRWAARNLRPGGIVVGDNAFLFGKLHLKPASAGADKPAIEGMREFLTIMTDTRIFSSCAMLPTGEGMAVAVKK